MALNFNINSIAAKISNAKNMVATAWKEINTGFIYDCDSDKFFKYIEYQVQKSLNNKDELCVNLYAYYKDVKHKISVINYTSSHDTSDQGKGIVYYIDDISFTSYSDFKENASFGRFRINDLLDIFKIELIDFDSEFFNPDYTGFKINK